MDAFARAVSTRRTVAASVFADAGSSPASARRRCACSRNFSRFSFDFASSFR